MLHLTQLAVSLFLANTTGSNQLVNASFEAGVSGWDFWATSKDSAQVLPATTSCRGTPSCLQVVQKGSQDWAVTSSQKVAVLPGDVWQWQAWVHKNGPGQARLCFVTRDSADEVLNWNQSPVAISLDTGWILATARFKIPPGCARISAKVTGTGPGLWVVDDADLRKIVPDWTRPEYMTVTNDSVSATIDPLSLAIVLHDKYSQDSVNFGPVVDLRFDSATRIASTLRVFTTMVANKQPVVLDLAPVGGAILLSLRADSAMSMSSHFPFPGAPTVSKGQYLAVPRGTGLAVPVELSPSSEALRSVQFWDWQITQGLTGATNGTNGFVISVDQPWDARVYFYTGTNKLLFPQLFQVPSKGVWAHDRSVLVAPLRSGGWTEMAKRHRSRLNALGRIRTWEQKAKANRIVDSLLGAVDIWTEGAWTNYVSTFDSLRLMGLNRAIINTWGASKAQGDSLINKGWVVSSYQSLSDAFPPQFAGYESREYSTGAAMAQDGSVINGYLSHLKDGTPVQAVEVCSARHPALARQIVKSARNARFIDVELAWTLLECWSPNHPVDRAHDAAARMKTLGIIKDSLGFVTGSEQHRDFATSVVDWGEGPMTIAEGANPGNDWTTPGYATPLMDSLSMSPVYRVPLLPLATHDAFAPTWHTGDGQSKVDVRWDDKDLWNALYVTMPLFAPASQRVWDSLQVRFLRSANLLGSLHSRCGFQPMTQFLILSPNRKVQQTAFANGWTVTVNFDSVAWSGGGVSLPPKGFLATNGTERIERSTLDRGRRSRVRLKDRWFLTPETEPYVDGVDGVRTYGSVFMRKENDTTVLLSLLGTQDYIDISPAQLCWPSANLTAKIWSTGANAPLKDLGNGWFRLARVGKARFYRLGGKFGALGTVTPPITRQTLHVVRSGSGWEGRWSMETPAPVQLQIFRADGKQLHTTTTHAPAGYNHQWFQASAGNAWVRIRTPSGTEVAAIPLLH